MSNAPQISKLPIDRGFARMRHEKGYADRSDGGGISHRGYSLRLRFQRERANLTLTDPGDLDQFCWGQLTNHLARPVRHSYGECFQ
jgi:hypothetical protein